MTRTSEAGALWGRFVLGESLGQGAFGEVVRAHDRELGIDVAIKRLVNADPSALFRFKQEFRSLVDLSHPNLVKLHELFCLGDDWYFSMDLVAGGRPFSRFVRGGLTLLTSAVTTKNGRIGNVAPIARGDREEADADADTRLRRVLPQLATGLRALHLAGLVHRDLKPSNVLVTDDSQLVILDFGLVAPMAGDVHELQVVGTPGYMAPEQFAGQPSAAPADWYAVGVMIYEALVGRLPFVDSVENLREAQLAGPAHPQTIRADVPPDLASLCIRLMSPRPEDRPTGSDVLAELGVDAAEAAPTGIASRGTFIGRTAELEMLRAAHAEIANGRPIVVQVHGASGIGKTALLRRFLDEIRITSTVVLEIRCHERETLRFKIMDGLVDALTQYLRALPRLVAASVMPRDPHALARLFPVFGRLPIVDAHPRRSQTDAPNEQRRRAFVALRELLARLADRQPVVIAFDDLQWGDTDSIAMLGELLVEPDPPAILVLASYRREEHDSSASLVSLRQRVRQLSRDGRELMLGELSPEDASALARARLGDGAQDSIVQRLVVESGRRPLLIEVLARDRAELGDGAQSLESVLDSRLSVLTIAARNLLVLLASAGHPLELAVARRAVKLSAGDAHAALAELRARNLVVAGTSTLGTTIEPLHARIREAVVRLQTSEEICAHHLAIVDALIELGRDDAELIAVHLQLADQPDRARPFLVAAAKKAVAVLSFDRAVELYVQALTGADGDERTSLMRQLAEVLAFAGRGSEAARVYAQAIESAAPGDRIELQRRVGEQLLRSGHITEGLEAVRPVLSLAGLSIPVTPRRALASYLAQRARLAIRGRRFKEREVEEISVDDLARVDVCWTVGTGLAAVDVVRGGDFQTRHLLHALDIGDPYRISRGLSLEAIMGALDGTRGQLRARTIVPEALTLAERIGNPHAVGWARAAAAVLAWSEARWRDATELAAQGIAVFQAHSIDSAWEVGALDVWFRLRPLLAIGELPRFVEGVALNLAEADERQDKFTLTLGQTTGLPWVHLIGDRPGEASAQSQSAIDAWTRDAWHIQHQENLRTQCLVELYEGRPANVLERIEAARPRFEAAMLERLQNERIQLWHLRGLALISGVRAGTVAESELRTVERDVHALRKDRHRWADVIAAALAAGVAAARKSPDASRLYALTAAAFDALGMVMHAAAASRRRGELLDGPARDTELEAADRRLANLGIVDPVRFARLLVA
jgi:eukaryotic-like serine/threonine-protein kinase